MTRTIKIVSFLLCLHLGMTFSFSVMAADCVARNEMADPFGGTNVSYVPTSDTISQCSEFVVMGKNEYTTLVNNTNPDPYANITATLINLFEFSVEDFAFFNAICLIGFITTHSVGRVVRYLGKT